jgi:multidrug efflux pump subunit AcrA (membrane-fusion protein)
MRIRRCFLCLTPAFLAVTGCYPQIDTGSQGEAVRPVDVIQVRREPVAEKLTLTGTTQPWQEATLYFEVPGIVAEVFVEEGDVVEAGVPLAQLVLDDYSLALAKAKADLAAAQAKLDLLHAGTRQEDKDAARADYARAKAHAAYWRGELPRKIGLLRKSAISEAELEQVRREHDAALQEEVAAEALHKKAEKGPRKEEIEAAAAEVQALKQAVALAQRQLDKATVRAPFRGYIEKRLMDAGAYVNVFPTGGVPVVHLVDLTQVDAVIAVPESQRGRVHGLQQVEIVSAVDPPTRLSGKVISLGQVADRSSGTYELRARISNGDGRLTGGMVVTAETANRALRQAIRIPLSALLHAYGQPPYVLLVEPGRQRVLAREVKLGPLAGDEVEIVDGLAEGNLLIVHGHDRVVVGDHVQHRLLGEQRVGQQDTPALPAVERSGE